MRVASAGLFASGLTCVPWCCHVPDPPTAAIYCAVAAAGFVIGLLAPTYGWLYAAAGTLGWSAYYGLSIMWCKGVVRSWEPSAAEKAALWAIPAVAAVSGFLSETIRRAMFGRLGHRHEVGADS